MLAGRTARPLHRLTHILPATSFVLSPPVFLCPFLQRCDPAFCFTLKTKRIGSSGTSTRRTHSSTHALGRDDGSEYDTSLKWRLSRLPRQCSGCGAFSQIQNDQEPGYYSLDRRSVKTYVDGSPSLGPERQYHEELVIQESPRDADEDTPERVLNEQQVSAPSSDEENPPLCDRCHNLLHHHAGVSIHHPSIDAIRLTLEESPRKYNHVYHVLDAADFPMSLIPSLQKLMNLTRLRSQNRRSRIGRYHQGKKFEVSFIITRSDLLAPLKSQVDALMPLLIEILRDALGSVGKNVRLGNVRCVSAKRGWWTKELREDVWHRGGAGWLVGKVNVGKSQLFESIFPKGRRGEVKLGQPLTTGIQSQVTVPAITEDIGASDEGASEVNGKDWADEDTDIASQSVDEYSLLPPLPSETNYPSMPLVSSLPGTTASPIRIPFGNGKGELIDLPGLSRGDLEFYVQQQYRPSLVMKSRVVPEQQVIKGGQSLLLGGFIRITPVHPDIIILAYSFTPIRSHLTSTEKAVGIQLQERESGVENIGIPGISEKIRSAGKFPLKWDVTKQRSGPVTASDAAGIRVGRLPYRVLSTDILIEGCGWVELVAQVRKKSMEEAYEPTSATLHVDSEDKSEVNPLKWPEVEVFSPEGKFVAARRPLGAWTLGRKKVSRELQSRPRRSMTGAKKRMKAVTKKQTTTNDHI